LSASRNPTRNAAIVRSSTTALGSPHAQQPPIAQRMPAPLPPPLVHDSRDDLDAPRGSLDSFGSPDDRDESDQPDPSETDRAPAPPKSTIVSSLREAPISAHGQQAPIARTPALLAPPIASKAQKLQDDSAAGDDRDESDDRDSSDSDGSAAPRRSVVARSSTAPHIPGLQQSASAKRFPPALTPVDVQRPRADKNSLAAAKQPADAKQTAAQIAMIPRSPGPEWLFPLGNSAPDAESSHSTPKSPAPQGAPGAQSLPAAQVSPAVVSEFYDNFSGRKTVEMSNGNVYAGGFLAPDGNGQYSEGSLWVTGITQVAAFCSYNLNTKASSSKYSIFGNGSGAEMLDWTLSAGPSVCPHAFTDMTRFALPSTFLGKVKVIDFNLGGSQRPGAGSYE
jgi:hypothetical protein